MVTIMIVLIIIVLVVAGYLIYQELIVNNPTRKYQKLVDQSIIKFNFSLNCELYSLAAIVNNKNNCTSQYLALVPTSNLSDSNSNLKVYLNPSNKYQFALRTVNDTFCYLINDAIVGQYISFGSIDMTNPAIYFSLSEDNILYSYQGNSLGLLNITNQDYLNCYNGSMINNNSYLFGIGNNSQEVILENISHPVKPLKINYPFISGDKLAISNNGHQLTLDCRENNLVSFANITTNPDPFIVTLSGDKLAFSLSIPLFDSQAYLGTLIQNNVVYLGIFDSLSDYNSGDYTTWFGLVSPNLSNNKLISLLTNLELMIDMNSNYPCQDVISYSTKFCSTGSDINIDILK